MTASAPGPRARLPGWLVPPPASEETSVVSVTGDPQTQAMADRLAALGHPTRITIVEHLEHYPEGLAVTALQEALGIPLSTLSHHLVKLVHCGIVSQHRNGRTLLCRVEAGVLADVSSRLWPAVRPPDGDA